MAKCKSCGGNAAKKLSLIVQEGSSSGDFRGVGVGSGGIGIGGGKTSSKSDLAAQASYAEGESSLEKVVFYGSIAITMFCIFVLEEFWLGLKIGFGVIFIFYILKAFGVIDKSGTAQQERERSSWERTWMCTDCGYKWVK